MNLVLHPDGILNIFFSAALIGLLVTLILCTFLIVGTLAVVFGFVLNSGSYFPDANAFLIFYQLTCFITKHLNWKNDHVYIFH